MFSLELLSSLLNRCLLCLCPAGKFSITISLPSLKTYTYNLNLNKRVQRNNNLLNFFRKPKKHVTYLPTLLFPRTGFYPKGERRLTHQVLVSNVILVIHLFLPKCNHRVLEFKFTKAPAQQALFKISETT